MKHLKRRGKQYHNLTISRNNKSTRSTPYSKHSQRNKFRISTSKSDWFL